jgi:hypothetical protein
VPPGPTTGWPMRPTMMDRPLSLPPPMPRHTIGGIEHAWNAGCRPRPDIWGRSGLYSCPTPRFGLKRRAGDTCPTYTLPWHRMPPGCPPRSLSGAEGNRPDCPAADARRTRWLRLRSANGSAGRQSYRMGAAQRNPSCRLARSDGFRKLHPSYIAHPTVAYGALCFKWDAV